MSTTTVTQRLVAGALALALVLAPALADAKAGKGKTMGSLGASRSVQQRGSSTPPPAAAIGPAPAVRSQPLPPPPSAVAPQAIPQAAIAAPMPPPRPSFIQRHPFVSGLMGGLVGAGIGSLLFGGHFLGEGSGGFFGALIQILLVLALGRLAWGLWRSRSAPHIRPAFNSGLAGRDLGLPRLQAPDTVAPRQREFLLGETDLQGIERMLGDIQAAWTVADTSTLQRLMTPEMSGYMDQMLRDDRARGVENHVEQVHLLEGDVDETWRENGVEYATVSLRWSALDYTLQNGQVIEGDARAPREAKEVWTMVRRPGSPWLLSAIQQM